MINYLFYLKILDLKFGNWEIFRQLVTGLREIERSQPIVKFNLEQSQADAPDTFALQIPPTRQKSTMEKQVRFGLFFLETHLPQLSLPKTLTLVLPKMCRE